MFFLHNIPITKVCITNGFFANMKNKHINFLAVQPTLYVGGHRLIIHRYLALKPKCARKKVTDFGYPRACTGCPITHGIHCKKSVKTKCQFKKQLGGRKKSEIQCPKNSFKHILSKAEYIRRVEDETGSL
jgi:hypothetical protein